MSEQQLELSVSKIINLLQQYMQKDFDLAWSWHCNLACVMQDEGMDHATANKAAARFMLMAFGVLTDAKAYAENIRSSNTENTNVELS